MVRRCIVNIMINIDILWFVVRWSAAARIKYQCIHS
uniref:Uncharacterized protein n=1 Tax=Setaria italica TaxID=4555 RepID=K3Z1J3_SETIT